MGGIEVTRTQQIREFCEFQMAIRQSPHSVNLGVYAEVMGFSSFYLAS